MLNTINKKFEKFLRRSVHIASFLVGVDWLCSKSTYILCYTAPKIYLLWYAALLHKSTYYAQTLANSLVLCANLPPSAVKQVLRFSSTSIWRAYTLTFNFHITSNCLGAQSLLNKDIWEETVTCELLPAIQLSSTGLVIDITESPSAWPIFRKALNDVISSQNLPIMLALCSMLLHTYYAYFNASIIYLPLHSSWTRPCVSKVRAFIFLGDKATVHELWYIGLWEFPICECRWHFNRLEVFREDTSRLISTNSFRYTYIIFFRLQCHCRIQQSFNLVNVLI